MPKRATGLLAPLLAATLLLAGCSDAPDAPAPAAEASGGAPVLAPVQVDVGDGPFVVHCEIVRTAVNVPQGGGYNGDDAEPCPFTDAGVDMDLVRSGAVEVTTAPQPTGVATHLRIGWDNCASLGIVCDPEQFTWDEEGTDSVRSDLGPDFFAAHGKDDPRAMVWANGASVGQAFHVYVSLFTTPTVPAGYSAVPA